MIKLFTVSNDSHKKHKKHRKRPHEDDDNTVGATTNEDALRHGIHSMHTCTHFFVMSI